MAGADGIPHMDCDVKEDDLATGVKKIVQILRPKWDVKRVKTECLSTGYTNKNYAVTFPADPEAGLFLRLINTQMPGLLDTAVKSMRYLKRRNIGAQLLLTFKNGLVMELLEGKAVTWETFHLVKEPSVWLGVAREVARYHGTTETDDIKELGIVSYDVIAQVMHEQVKGALTMMKVDMKSLGLPSVDEIKALKDKVYESLLADGSEMAFTHLDVNPTNILLTPKGPIYIDYDVCLYDLPCVNIAILLGSVMNIMNVNFDDLPTEAERDAFIREYLKARAELKPSFGPVTEELVKYWKFMVDKAALISHLTYTTAIVMLQGVSTKGIDVGLAGKFWGKYKENEKILYMKYSK